MTEAKPKKLSAKLKKKIQLMWETYCDCDHLGDEEVKEVLEEGGAAAAAYMESDESEIYLLGSAMANSNWELAALMMDAGATPTGETREMADHWEKFGDEGDAKQEVLERLRG